MRFDWVEAFAVGFGAPLAAPCDPACGSAGFLVAAAEYIHDRHEKALFDETQRNHFHRSMFHGYDFDATYEHGLQLRAANPSARSLPQGRAGARDRLAQLDPAIARERAQLVLEREFLRCSRAEHEPDLAVRDGERVP